jgi:NUMOD3 motif-containing protein
MSCTYGFVYIWFDKKHRRFYLGSHFGTEDDGYVCSSKWMKQAYNIRPDDFRRRIIYRCPHNDRSILLREEERWLKMITPEEIKSKKYYNRTRRAYGLSPREVSEQFKYHWSDPEAAAKHIESQKRSWTPERRAAHSAKIKAKREAGAYANRSEKIKAKWASGAYTCHNKPLTDEHKAKLSAAGKGRPAWNKGISHSEESKAKISASTKGKPKSPETRARIAIAAQKREAAKRLTNLQSMQPGNWE